MSFENISVNSGENHSAELAKVASIKSQYFTFEAIVRSDRTLVIHLKDLRRDFQNPKVLDRLAKFISDRIGQCDNVKADFLGSFADKDGTVIQNFNSLDVFVTGYAPLLVRDHRFVVHHICGIGTQLVDELNRTL